MQETVAATATGADMAVMADTVATAADTAAMAAGETGVVVMAAAGTVAEIRRPN
jgi:hypothetical protein